MTVELISLDVGGVLLVPDHGFLALALDRAEVAYDPDRLGVAHYHAMHAVDEAESDPEHFGDYLDGFLAAVGVPTDGWEVARVHLEPLFATPIWCQAVPGSRAAVHALADAGARLAVTSNADGTVKGLLARRELVQEGEGHGTPVEVIVDSGELGVAKPDRRIFEATAAATGVPLERILHVGDSVHYDVAGAAAAGMVAVHFDPYELCTHDDHDHVVSLAQLAAWL